MSQETEGEIVARAKAAISQMCWEVGRRAALWDRLYSKGRKIDDFAAMIGLPTEKVQILYRVTVQYRVANGDQVASLPFLYFAHFQAAAEWPEHGMPYLRWANEMKATVPEMRAYQRAQGLTDARPPVSAATKLFNPKKDAGSLF